MNHFTRANRFFAKAQVLLETGICGRLPMRIVRASTVLFLASAAVGLRAGEPLGQEPRSELDTVWQPGPGGLRPGLGPHFDARSCAECHSAGPGEREIVLRVSVPGIDQHGGPRPHPLLGLQLTRDAIPGLRPKGRFTVIRRPARADDGSPPLRPEVRVETSDRPPADDLRLSLRRAPPLAGLALLEAVPDEVVIGGADPEDLDGDGVLGRPNLVWDQALGAWRLGRFGWKAGQPNLRQTVARELWLQMGVTSTLYPEDCPQDAVDCLRADRVPDPELGDAALDRLVAEVAAVPPPSPSVLEDTGPRWGARLFEEAGCATCHRPRLTTGPHAQPERAYRTISPYTDLLLHDMGPGLADDLGEFFASGREWRTAPLWGLSQRRGGLLHDGRARTLIEAILWHDGEAATARRRVRALDAADLAALLEFLRSL